MTNLSFLPLLYTHTHQHIYVKCINYDILAIGVNIYHLISNKNVKTCKSLPDGSPSHMHQYISRQTLFPIAELWIVKYIRYPFRAYDELAARCSAGTDSLLLKSQSTVCERFPLLSLPPERRQCRDQCWKQNADLMRQEADRIASCL